MKPSLERCVCWSLAVLLFVGAACGRADVVAITPSSDDGSVTAYTQSEIHRVFLDHLNTQLKSSQNARQSGRA